MVALHGLGIWLLMDVVHRPIIMSINHAEAGKTKLSLCVPAHNLFTVL
jgi:hypothetical protein